MHLYEESTRSTLFDVQWQYKRFLKCRKTCFLERPHREQNFCEEGMKCVGTKMAKLRIFPQHFLYREISTMIWNKKYFHTWNIFLCCYHCVMVSWYYSSFDVALKIDERNLLEWHHSDARFQSKIWNFIVTKSFGLT